MDDEVKVGRSIVLRITLSAVLIRASSSVYEKSSSNFISSGRSCLLIIWKDPKLSLTNISNNELILVMIFFSKSYTSEIISVRCCLDVGNVLILNLLYERQYFIKVWNNVCGSWSISVFLSRNSKNYKWLEMNFLVNAKRYFFTSWDSKLKKIPSVVNL